jgi:putative Mg2+ transporter-C (MgtC) family protein
MEFLFEELCGGVHDPRQLVRALLRLLVATMAGAIIGWQRERIGKPAGLRTHMLVALGAALFVVGPACAAMDQDALSRVIQGIATGIGFIGGGAILKLREEQEILGLTTAAGIWMTAAVGVTAGLGLPAIALLGAGLTWGTLDILGRWEDRLARGEKPPPGSGSR